MQFTNTALFCDIQTRYDPDYTPSANQLDWNPSETFQAYLESVKERRNREREQQAEDALMAVIDSMNAPEDESGSDRDRAVTNALHSASQAVSAQSNGKCDPTENPLVQAILSCLGDRARWEMADKIQEAQEAQETLKGGEEDECDRPVHDAADAADGRRDDEFAQIP